MSPRSWARRASRVALLCLVMLALVLPRAASADPFTDAVNNITNAWSSLVKFGGMAMGTLTGAVTSAGKSVGNLIVDKVGAPVAYEVVRGTRPLVRATANTAGVVMTKTATGVTVTFTAGLNGATNVGTVVISNTGEIAGTVATSVVDGVEYAYENGSIVVANLAGLDCATIAGLGDTTYNLDNVEGAAADCSARIGLGFACALPSSVFDLMAASDALFSEIQAASMKAPCNKVPIPPANFVCGAQMNTKRQVEALAQCVLKMKASFPQSEATLDGRVCKTIGETLFNVVLDIAMDGANTETVVYKIAMALKQIYNLTEKIETISDLVEVVCKDELPGTVARGAAPVTAVTLFKDAGASGTSWVVQGTMATMPAGMDNEVSSISLPENTTIAVFSAPNFMGTCDTISTSIPTLAYGNIGGDRVSSLRVNEVCPGPSRVELYDDASYGGRVVRLGYDIPDLDSAGFAYAASSVKLLVPGSYAVYSEANYRGACLTVTGNAPSLSTAGFPNDRVRSVKFDAACGPVRATLYADAKFAGTVWTITNDVTANKSLSSDNLSSIRFAPGSFPVAVVRDDGACVNVSADVSSFESVPGGSGFGDHVQAIRFNATCSSPTAYAPSGRPGAIVTEGNRCLGAPTTTADPVVSARVCDGSPEQGWRFEGPLIRDNLDRCLFVLDVDQATPNALVRVHACNGADAERFSIRDQHIVDLAGRCLQIPMGGLFDDAAGLVVAPCEDTLAQRFTPVAIPRVGLQADTPLGATLDCGMDVPGKRGPVCRSANEPLELTLPGTERFVSSADQAPLAATLSTNVAAYVPGSSVGTAATLPDRVAHDPQDGDFTVSVWARALSTAGRQVLVAKGNNAATDAGWSVAMVGGKLVWRVADGQGHSAALTSPPVRVGAWQHVLATVDRKNGTLRAWLDGSPVGWTEGAEGVASASLVSFAPVTSAVGLSVRGAGSAPWLGEVDRLTLYPRALDGLDLARLLRDAPSANLARGPGARARQSSTALGADATRLVDGNRDAVWANGSLNHTNGVAGTWVEVDLGAATAVRRVDLFNRADCCGERLANVTVQVQTAPCDAAATVLASRTTGPDVVGVYHLSMGNDPVGRYVCLRANGANPLNFAELEVYGPPSATSPALANLARSPGAVARQSSVAVGGVPERAIDGNRDGTWDDGSVTHTDEAPGSWFELDLGRRADLTSITLFNRADECCSSRFTGLQVEIRDTACDVPGTALYQSTVADDAPSATFTPAAGMKGRYVCVRHDGVVSLAEIEVLGVELTPAPSAWPVVVGAPPAPAPISLARAPGASIRQSSYSVVYPSWATRATDGWRNGNWWASSVAGSDGLSNSWVEIDLGRPTTIGVIDLYNRTDCCTTPPDNNQVQLSNVPCDAPGYTAVATRTLAPPSPRLMHVVYADKPTARYVCVRAPMAASFAEIEVYAP